MMARMLGLGSLSKCGVCVKDVARQMLRSVHQRRRATLVGCKIEWQRAQGGKLLSGAQWILPQAQAQRGCLKSGDRCSWTMRKLRTGVDKAS